MSVYDEERAVSSDTSECLQLSFFSVQLMTGNSFSSGDRPEERERDSKRSSHKGQNTAAHEGMLCVPRGRALRWIRWNRISHATDVSLRPRYWVWFACRKNLWWFPPVCESPAKGAPDALRDLGFDHETSGKCGLLYHIYPSTMWCRWKTGFPWTGTSKSLYLQPSLPLWPLSCARTPPISLYKIAWWV